jgi:transcription elongation factor Elf1
VNDGLGDGPTWSALAGLFQSEERRQRQLARATEAHLSWLRRARERGCPSCGSHRLASQRAPYQPTRVTLECESCGRVVAVANGS